jgi:hypothetical protein
MRSNLQANAIFELPPPHQARKRLPDRKISQSHLPLQGESKVPDAPFPRFRVTFLLHMLLSARFGFFYGILFLSPAEVVLRVWIGRRQQALRQKQERGKDGVLLGHVSCSLQ